MNNAKLILAASTTLSANLQGWQCVSLAYHAAVRCIQQTA
jgi:hypothetical protein